MIHELVADIDLLYHLGNAELTTTLHGEWKAFFLPGPRSDVSIGASAVQGQLNALTVSSLPTATPTQVVPLGRVEIFNTAATENLSWISSELTRVGQRAFASYGSTDDGIALVHTEALEAGAAVSLERTYPGDAFILELGGAFVHLKRIEDPTMPRFGNRLDRQVNPRGVIVWQHDINKHWSTNADAGIVWVHPILDDPYNPTVERKPALFPIFGALVAYTDVWGRAQAYAHRGVTPNLFIAQNTLSDSLVVSMAMPIHLADAESKKSEPKVVGLAAGGVERTQLIEPVTSMLQGQFTVVRADLGVAWQPRPGQTYGVRYEFAYQNGDTVAEMIVPTFVRNTIYFTFALRYPDDVQVRVPRRNQSVRADRNDLAPIGAEPVVVDPAEQLLEEDRR